MCAHRRRTCLLVCHGIVFYLTSALSALQPAWAQMIPRLGGDFEQLWLTENEFGWAEGPAYDGAGGVWFADLGNVYPPPGKPPGPSRLMRFDIASGVTEVVVDADENPGATGLAFDDTGRLISAEGFRARVTRRPAHQPDQIEVLAASSPEVPFGPNDLVIDDQGGIYFTDWVPPRGLPPEESAIYYIPSEGGLQQASKGIPLNNGLALSPDGNTLYVAASRSREIVALDVNDDGTLSNQRPFVASPGGPDGLAVDRFGHLYVADAGLKGPPPPQPGMPGSKVIVWNNQGQEILSFAPPQGAINVTLGPPGDSLYITGWNSLYRVPLRFVPDWSGDGLLGVEDVDLLSTELWRPSGNEGFDLTGDGAVDRADVDELLSLVNRFNGDADFNGEVQFSDFLILANSFGEADKRWSEGDFNSDGEVQFPDFTILADNFGKSFMPAAAAVPEPSAFVLLLAGMVVGSLLGNGEKNRAFAPRRRHLGGESFVGTRRIQDRKRR